MSALNNVLSSQTNPRPASPAAAGLTVTSNGKSGGQDRSFEDTLSQQTDVNAANETNKALMASDSNSNNRGFVTLPEVDNELETTVTADLSADLIGLTPDTQVPPTTLDVSIPLNDAATTIPMADISALVNREATLPVIVADGDPTTGPTPFPNVADGQPNLIALGTSPASQTAATPMDINSQTLLPSKGLTLSPASGNIVPQTTVNPGETSAAQLTNAAAQTSLETAPEIKTVKLEGATLPTAIAAGTATTANAETPAPDINATDRPGLSDRAAETADYRALTKASASPSDLAKAADAPAHPTTMFAGSDAPAPLKSVPVMATLPTLTPLSGMSDRLAATILQTTNAQPAVTMDKLPQAVVAIALSAKSATLQIDPPELGRIQLDYQFDSQGRTVVTLTPESDAARAALMDRMASITAALEQGTNSPVDVKLGDARDFGSEFGQASQNDNGTGSEQQDGANGSTSDNIKTDDLQRFVRAPVGEAERLHILV